MNESPRERLTAVVHGSVQAVGYRAYCQRTAAMLSGSKRESITGYARNMASGASVEVVAEGPRDMLERLLVYVREGPSLARVLDVEVTWGTPSDEFTDFRGR
jgi:acylphosphatase